MRRLLTVLSAIIFLISCAQQSSDTQQKKPRKGLGAIITRVEAAKLISAFLNHPKLGSYAREKDLGGIFEKSVFDLDDTRAGSLLWFCYNAKEPENRQLYLAASKVTGYTPAVTRDATDDLWKPYDFFRYTESSGSETEVLKYLESHQYGAPGKSPLISQAEVRIQTEDFMKTFLPNFDPDPRQLMEYSFCFFGEMSEDYQIRKLVTQPGVAGIRYYFGFQEKDEHGKEINNKIRVIMVAIDIYGKNILGNKDAGDDIMVERSFPPPPESGT